MNAEEGKVLVFLGTQVQPQIILKPDCLTDYLSVYYDYVYSNVLSMLLIGRICMLKIVSNFQVNSLEGPTAMVTPLLP